MRDLVPDEIRLRTSRGRQAADAVDGCGGRRGSARDPGRFDRNPQISALLDTAAMRRALLDGTLDDPEAAQVWVLTHARAFGLGRFVEWYDEQRAARGQRPGTLRPA